MSADHNIELLVQKITASIEGQNWTDQPLTDGERTVIDMAVRATMYELCRKGASAADK